MTPNWVIFLVGALVTIAWGSVVGALLYAAVSPFKGSNAAIGAEPLTDRKSSSADNE